MPTYYLNYADHVEDDLSRLDSTICRRIEARITRLGERPETGKRLEGPLAGLRSVRVSGCRIIYKFDPSAQSVTVVLIGARQAGKGKDVYKCAERRR